MTRDQRLALKAKLEEAQRLLAVGTAYEIRGDEFNANYGYTAALEALGEAYDKLQEATEGHP